MQNRDELSSQVLIIKGSITIKNMNRLMVNYDLLRENAEPFRNRNVFYGLPTCEKLPIYLYRTTTLVKLLGHLCSHSSLG